MRNFSIALAVKEPTPCPSLKEEPTPGPSLKGRGMWLLLLIAVLLATIATSSLATNPPSFQGEARVRSGEGSTATEGWVGDSLSCDTFTILFTGDILLDRGVRHYLEHGGMRRVIPDETADFLRSADFVVGNLECPATTIHAPAFKRFVFRGEPQWLDSLRAYGFTHLNLANNHSVDQGRQGLRDTRLNILRAGMIPFGADSTMQAAAQAKTLPLKTLPPAPPCMEGSNMPLSADTAERVSTPLHTGRGRGEGLLLGRVYLLASNRLPLESFAYLPDRESVSQEPFDSLVNRVKAIKMADSIAVVIVNLHWGAEHTLRPLPQQRLEAHALIDAGADVIIGHHTHTLQTSETYHGKPIFYSVGNFIFDQQRPLNTEACIVRLCITPEKTMADAIPVRIDHCAPHIISSAE